MKALLVGYPIAVLIAALGVGSAQFAYSQVDWPAWVQATDSVGGIALAVWIPYWQRKLMAMEGKKHC